MEGYTGPETIAVDAIPFAVELPASDQISYVQIKRNNQIIAKSSIHSLKLLGIINRIPLDAFKAIGCNKKHDQPKYAQKERDALLKLAIISQNLLDSKHPELAKLPLRTLILSIKAMTSNKYYPAEIDQLSQSSAVAEIKAIIKSLDKKSVTKKGK